MKHVGIPALLTGFVFISAVFLGGCSLQTETESSPIGVDLSQISPSPADGGSGGGGDPIVPGDSSGEQAVWDSIVWLTGRGPACTGAQKIGIDLTARIEGDFVYFDWTGDVESQWDYESLEEEILVHFFRQDPATGIWTGGKFDWIREGGQTVKGLENIVNGYQGHTPGRSGEKVAFAWTDAYGTERTNIAYCTWE